MHNMINRLHCIQILDPFDNTLFFDHDKKIFKSKLVYLPMLKIVFGYD